MISVERGELALVCNLDDAPHRVALCDVLLTSEGLASIRELPPQSCVLVRR